MAKRKDPLVSLRGTFRLALPAGSLLMMSFTHAYAASATWNSSPTNGNWVATGGENNWSTGANTFPGSTVVLNNPDIATFSSASSTTSVVINSPTLNLGGITFGGTAANFTIGSTGGNALQMTDGGLIRFAGSLTSVNAIETINAPLSIQGANGTLNLDNASANGSGAGAGTLNVNGAISGAAAGNTTLNLSGSNTNANTLSGTISNGAATALKVAKTGAGTWMLTGTNTYSGGTTISGGTLAINNGSALGTGSVNVNSGGTLLGTANLTFSGNNIIINDATVAAAAGTVMTLNTGTTGTVSMGPGNVTFGSAGNTGVVVIGNSAIGSTVLATPTITVAFGTLRNGGGSPSPLSFFTNFTTSTTVNAGARLDTNGFQTTVSQLFGAGTLLNDAAALGTFNIQSGNFSGVIQDGAGATALNKTTSGTLILTGASTHTGGTTITEGTLQIGNGGATGSIAGNVVNNATLAFNRDNIAFGGAISGTGSVTSNVTGTLTLTGVSSYSGGTIVNSGVLAIDNGKALGNGSVNVKSGSTLLGMTNLTFTGNNIIINDATVAAATGTVMTLNTGTTGTVSMGPGNVTFGSAGNTGVVVIGNSAIGSTVLATPTITVAFGTLRNGGGSPSPLSFFTNFTTSTTVNAGAKLDTNGFQTTVSNLLGAGTLINDAAAVGTFNIQTGTFTGNIQDGAGVTALTKSTSGTLTFTGAVNNTYTGPTNINDGTLLLDNILAGNAGIRSTVINVGDDVGAAGSAVLRMATTGENISNQSAVVMKSDGLFDLNGLNETIGSLAGTAGGQVTLAATGTLATGANNSDTTFSGTISGGAATAVIKAGTGTWTLASANTYAGQTFINGGTLATQNVSALGTGSVIVNGGALLPDGNLTVAGTYTQGSPGALRIGIGGTGAGQHGLLNVVGTATLDGTLQLVETGGYQLHNGDNFTFLTSVAGVVDEFAQVDLARQTILTPTVTYAPNQVSVQFNRGSFGDFATGAGLTPNQRAVAANLDNVSADTPNDPALLYLDNRALTALPGDFDLIAPEELSAMYEITRTNTEAHFSSITDQLAMARAGSRGFVSKLSVSYQGGRYPTDAKDTGPMPSAFTASPDNPWGVWTGGSADFVDVDGNANAKGFNFDTGGVTLGIDYRVNPHFILGLAGTYANTTTDLVGNGDIDAESGRLAAYATWFNGGAYVNAIVGGGYNSFDTRRSALGGFASGSTDGSEFDALLGGGYDFKAGRFTFGPTASLAYTSVDIDGFTETGSLAPLAISSQSQDNLRSRIGGHLQAEFKAGGVILRPEIRAEWQHDYLDDYQGIGAVFATGAGGGFTVHGPVTGRDSLLLGVGLSAEWNPSVATYINYETELGRDNYTRQSVNLGLRASF